MAWKNPHILTEEDRRKGGRARAARLSPERRSLAATNAITRRWYSPRGSHMERIDGHLRAAAAIAVRGWQEGDDKKVLQALSVMATFERKKIWLDRDSGRPV